MYARMLIGFLLLALAGCEDPNTAANAMFVEAKAQIDKSTTQDSEKKLATLREASIKLKRIVEKYPSSTLAVQLSSGQTIGTISLSSVEQSIERAVRPARRAHCAALPKPSQDCVFEEALATAEAEIAKSGPRSFGTYFEVAKTQLDGGDLKAAALTLGLIKAAAGALPVNQGRGNVLAAVPLFEAMIKAAEQASAGQVSDALKTLEPFSEQTRTSSGFAETFADIAVSHAKAARTEAAANVLKVADALARAVQNDGYMALAQIAIGRATTLAYAGRFEEARTGAAPLALDRIMVAEAVAHAKAGRKAEALKAAEAVGSYLGSLRTLCVVAETYAKAGRATEAAEILKRVMAQLAKLPPLNKPDALALAAPALASAGQLADAFQAADAIANDELRDKTIAEIVRVLAETGQFAEARKRVADLKNGTWRVVALDYIAAAAPKK